MGTGVASTGVAEGRPDVARAERRVLEEPSIRVAPVEFAPEVQAALADAGVEIEALTYAELRHLAAKPAPRALVLAGKGSAATLLDHLRELRARGVDAPCLCLARDVGDTDRRRAAALGACRIEDAVRLDGEGLRARLVGLLRGDVPALAPDARAHASGEAAEAWAPAVSWRTDASGDLRHLAPRWALLTGREPDDEHGGSWLDAIHPEDRPAFAAQWEEAIEAAREVRADLRVRGPDGHWTWVRIHGIPCQDRDGCYGGHVGSTYEIDDLRRALDELRRERDQLREAVAEVDELRTVATHDLREPVRGLRHLLTRLVEHPPAALADGVARQCQELATNLEDLVEGLQDYAAAGRIGIDAEACSLREALDWALANLRRALEAEHAEVEIAELPQVIADPVQIGRVFQNLVANALRFRGVRAPLIRISAERADGFATISVADNGMGIAAEAHDTIFRVFERLHGPEVPGTGAGLAICRKLVDRHGGRIWVESRPGAGSTFRFTLPLAETRAEAPCAEVR